MVNRTTKAMKSKKKGKNSKKEKVICRKTGGGTGGSRDRGMRYTEEQGRRIPFFTYIKAEATGLLLLPLGMTYRRHTFQGTQQNGISLLEIDVS